MLMCKRHIDWLNWPATQACAPTGNEPVTCLQASAQSTEPHQPGPTLMSNSYLHFGAVSSFSSLCVSKVGFCLWCLGFLFMHNIHSLQGAFFFSL